MSAHISDELPRLLSGEASRDDVLDAAAHLRECPDCQQELVSAVVAHASLTSAHRFAAEVVAHESESAAALPDLSSVFARARLDSGSRRWARPRNLVAAVAAVAVLGTGAGILAAVNTDSPATGREVALSAFQTGTTAAKATIHSGAISLDATSLPNLAGKRYEVWLTNPNRTQMQPIGWIGSNGKASLSVPSDLVARFTDLEVSVQPIGAADYQYSNVSVLRGAYRS